LAKIAAELDHALTQRREDGTPGRTRPRILARGEGWTVADVLCTSGPGDCPFEEQHERYAIAAVLAGSFQYCCARGRGLMTPGALMLGNHGDRFECRHEHGEGDRCVAFWYAPDYFEQLAADAGMRSADVRFTVPCLPALRDWSALVARAGIGVTGSGDVAWEEMGIRLAVDAMRTAAGMSSGSARLPLNAEERVTKTVRTIDQYPDRRLTLDALARDAGLSRYHFLRTFERIVGVTPHQYVRRARLRESAVRLLTERGTILEIALDCGFEDISTFNRAFRAEFGNAPRLFRQAPQ
jgi:AraC family transcriptional regulator